MQIYLQSTLQLINKEKGTEELNKLISTGKLEPFKEEICLIIENNEEEI